MSEDKKKVDIHWQSLSEKIAISFQWMVAGLIAGLILAIPLYMIVFVIAIIIG